MIDLLYIASASFSGSTLLTFLLAAHSRIATIGELKATSRGDVDKYRCSCGELIRACTYWRRVAEEHARRGVEFDVAQFGTHFRFQPLGSLADRAVRAQVRGPLFEATRSQALRFLPRAARQFRSVLDRNRILVETICDLKGARVFLDGSKDSIRLKYLIESGLWNVKVVHLVRDGRGTTRSLMKRGADLFPGIEDRPSLLRAAAAGWRRVNESCERVLSMLPRDSWVRVRYEDLCRDPEMVLASILPLVGEGPMTVVQDFRAFEHHILGNAMRLRREAIEVDEKWRRDLSEADLVIFEREAGRMNRRHGYV